MIENNETFEEKYINSYVALGSFDGLHKGHLSLLDKIVSLAKENSGKSIVYTFRNHPRTFIKSKTTPKLLLDNKTKVEILRDRNVDFVYFEDFNEEYMKLSPEQFVDYLCKKFNVRGLVVGFNYKFGYKNSGNIKLLEELSKTYGYSLYIMEPCNYEGTEISSTRIREAIGEGNIDVANEMLTRPYVIRGEVIHGKKLGRTIGFPTANLKFQENTMLPKKGVYYTNVEWNNKIYKGITSIGKNPTVNGEKVTLETFILGFNEEIYGDELKVYFVKRIRDEIKFNTLDELVNKIKEDEIFARKEKLFGK